MKLFTILFFVSAFFIASCGSGRINKDASSHSQFISQSKLNSNCVVSLDTVYYKGEPYAILKETGISFAPFYNFYTLTGNKAIEVVPYSGGDGKATSHHEYRFFGNSEGMKGYMDFAFSTIGVCENVINNNLMNSNELRPIDVGNFVKKNPRPKKFNPGNLKVKREMTLAIKINQGYGEIYQGDKLIGKFVQGKEKNDNDKYTKAVFKVSFLNGTECAKIKFPYDKFDRKDNRALEVYTEYDDENHNLSIDDANTTFDVDAFKQAVIYLVNKGYL